MLQNQYPAQQLDTLLKDFQSKRVSGILYLEAELELKRKKRSRVLVLRNGEVTYGGLNLPTNQGFAKRLGQKFQRGSIDVAINLALEKVSNKTSFRLPLELLVKMQQVTWKEIETAAHDQVVITLEQVLPYAGQFQIDTTTQFDLCHGDFCRGLDWFELMLDVNRRQEEWSALVPLIPSMEAVPSLQANTLERITDPPVLKHLQEWVDGERSLVDIAERLDRDPLQVAQEYLPWVQADWVKIEGSTPPPKKNDLPTILAVDDSLVMQAAIKRALSGHYHVLVAGSAKDALILLNSNKVALLLLDVSMPEIDGLELCRTVRSLPSFRDLPIVMLTARDGVVNKIKGQIAGSTKYLMKPLDAEELLQVIEKLLS